MMPNRLLSLLLGVLCAVPLAGCVTQSRGEPAPATRGATATTDSTPPSGSPAPGDGLPSDGAPAVETPLDTSEYQQVPCRSLTAAQSRSLNVGDAGEPFDGGLGNGCRWSNAQTRGEAQIVFLDKDPRGLSALYRADQDGKFAYFEELPPIEGYPAIARDIVDDRSKGHCAVVVGVSDEIAFETILQLSLANVGKKDSCVLAAQVTGMALQTMRQGA